jgi:hypothetical protein
MLKFRWLTYMAGISIAYCGTLELSPAAVIISEIMYNADGSDAGREWVEIYNTGATPVDLEGWRLFDEDGGSQPGSPIPSGVSLAPAQALVLIEDQAVFEGEWGTGLNVLVYPGMGTSLNMANSGSAIGDEVLQLVDANDNLVDAVDYSAEAPFPAVTEDDETAIFVLPGRATAGQNDLGASWGRSTAGLFGAVAALDGGTEAGSPGFVAIPEPAAGLLLLLGVAPYLRWRSARRDA